MNAALATLAAVLWTTAYAWFFGRELKRWWRGRDARRAQAEAARARARAAYSAWVRDIPPPPSRVPIFPPPPAPPPPRRPGPAVARGGVVVPFPRR
ncbi:MAG: hypothetical protein J0I21_09370 [Alphaproteobacteria bacterium]|nr:hypothetical protein [Alphaproteobacteria bacterium]